MIIYSIFFQEATKTLGTKYKPREIQRFFDEEAREKEEDTVHVPVEWLSAAYVCYALCAMCSMTL